MRNISLCFLFVFCTVISVAAQSADIPYKPLVAVMVSDDHYKADKLLPPLMEKLGKENNWNTVILHGKGTDTFANIEVLEKADTLVVFIRRLALPKEQLAVVKKFVQSGRGLVGLRTACHAFTSNVKPLPEGHENWEEFDRDILGGNYHNHGNDALGSEIENVPVFADSPILEGVKPNRWHSIGSLYFTAPVKDDVAVYQTASSSQQQNVPLTWTRLLKVPGGTTRTAFTALGHQKDFETEAYPVLIRNLVRWTLEKK